MERCWRAILPGSHCGMGGAVLPQTEPQPDDLRRAARQVDIRGASLSGVQFLLPGGCSGAFLTQHLPSSGGQPPTMGLEKAKAHPPKEPRRCHHALLSASSMLDATGWWISRLDRSLLGCTCKIGHRW